MVLGTLTDHELIAEAMNKKDASELEMALAERFADLVDLVDFAVELLTGGVAAVAVEPEEDEDEDLEDLLNVAVGGHA